MPNLVLGPLLRYVSEDCAVFWVETDGPCEVEVLGSSDRTFEVSGHHYGLVRAAGLEPGSWHEYEVLLDGERAWPEEGSDWPPSAFRTYGEAWSEAVCAGAWGGGAARLGERIRQTFDLEHWAAFRESFERLAELQRSVAAGERGRAPASVVTLSGDVHHAYLCEVAFPRGSGVQSAVWQAVCSPFRNPLDQRERQFILAAWSSAFRDLARVLARGAGVPDPPVRWRLAHDEAWFDNQVATLAIEGRRLDLRLEKVARGEAEDGGGGDARLECVLERRLA